MALKISISFKENEAAIYDHIKRQLSESIYIKQLVINDMGVKNEPLKNETVSNKNQIFDF